MDSNELADKYKIEMPHRKPMANYNLSNSKIIGLVASTLIIGILGGSIYSTRIIQPEINVLNQDKNRLLTKLTETQKKLVDTNTTLTIREKTFESAQDNITKLQEDIEMFEKEILLLESEIDKITDSYHQIEADYIELSSDYESLLLQTQYQLSDIFLKKDFSISYDVPTKIYTSRDFTVEGETTRFDYSLMCEAGTIDPSAKIRIYKAGTSVRVYSKTIKIQEEPDLDLHTSFGSFSLVLEEGEYRLQLYISNGSLTPTTTNQSNIHIWDYR